ncbi:LysR substrate-binding domain-containing protein [Aestuariivirga sp.]|uniref:LysR substrate-binding domain-containing protein n=1 Tax=Aestuariivirga sp. TaxID=2650926 RepID=UPI0039E6F3C1
MVRRHYNLPSLNALAAFEAAARHLSLTRAASELNVTPGAVSKQVKSLEDEIARPLFIRLHRALQLTPEGETIYRALRENFERISSALQTVRTQGAARTVSLGTTMAFAQLWLMPRLGTFWNAHQDIIIDHIISDRAQDILPAGIELRVRYGDGTWPNEFSRKLFDDRIVAVASPGFAKRHPVANSRDLTELPLLSVEGMDWTWTTWADFLRETGGGRRKPNVRRFNSYVIALQAAQDGQGVALGWMRLVKPLIERKALVQVTDAAMPAPHAYYVTWSADHTLSAEAEILKAWLLDQAA